MPLTKEQHALADRYERDAVALKKHKKAEDKFIREKRPTVLAGLEDEYRKLIAERQRLERLQRESGAMAMVRLLEVPAHLRVAVERAELAAREGDQDEHRASLQVDAARRQLEQARSAGASEEAVAAYGRTVTDLERKLAEVTTKGEILVSKVKRAREEARAAFDALRPAGKA